MYYSSFLLIHSSAHSSSNIWREGWREGGRKEKERKGGREEGRKEDGKEEEEERGGGRNREQRRGYISEREIIIFPTCDHVLDVVSMSGTVNVGVVSIVRLIFDVCCRDGDPPRLLLRGIVNIIIGLELGPASLC